MVASIRREFKADPNRVIEVIHERLSPAVVKRLLADLPKWRDEADVRTAQLSALPELAAFPPVVTTPTDIPDIGAELSHDQLTSKKS